MHFDSWPGRGQTAFHWKPTSWIIPYTAEPIPLIQTSTLPWYKSSWDATWRMIFPAK